MPKHLTFRVHLPPALASNSARVASKPDRRLSAIVVQALERLLGDEDQTVFQTSTVNALMEGASTGEMTMGELKTHGDFGLGTFDGLDGEMIELDGKVFQVRADGHAHPVEDSVRTPFATVSFFKADESARLDRVCESGRDAREGRHDAPVAEHFPRGQNRRPLRLREDSRGREAGQVSRPRAGGARGTVFEFHDVEGTIVGFFTPDYLRGVNVPGYHLHFITADRTAGGHMLDCRTRDVTIKIHHTPEFELGTPGTEEFLKADLSRDHTAAIVKIER